MEEPIEVTFRFYDGQGIICYANILARQSETFTNLFAHNFPQLTEFEIPFIPYEPFILMLACMHGFCIEIKTIEDALLFYFTCHMYNYMNGIRHARRFILHLLTEENAPMVHDRIKLYKDQLILKKCCTEIKMSVLRTIRQRNFFENDNIDQEVGISQALNDIMNDQLLESKATKAMNLLKFLTKKVKATLEIILPGEDINFPDEMHALLDLIDDSGTTDDESSQDRRNFLKFILNEPVDIDNLDRNLRKSIDAVLIDIRNDKNLGLQTLRGLHLLQLLGRTMEKLVEIIFPDKTISFSTGLVALFDVVEV